MRVDHDWSLEGVKYEKRTQTLPGRERHERPRGLMDKASDFGSEDCEFESRRGRIFTLILNINSVLWKDR